MITKLQGYIIHIDRGGEIGTHASEVQVEHLHKDYRILNSESLGDLQTTIKDHIDYIRGITDDEVGSENGRPGWEAQY